MASRMAARSTTAGTPVKSCISTRAGRKAISRSEVLVLSHCATACMSSLVTRAAILVAQQIFQQHLHRERQARNALEAVLLGRGEAVKGVGLAADLERLAASETVERSHEAVSHPGGEGTLAVALLPERPPSLPVVRAD